MKKLFQEIQEVIKRGTFKLKGGGTSDYYLDIRSLFGNPKTMRRIGRALVDKLPAGTTCIAASGYGGISIGTIVSQITGLPLVLVRNEKKSHGIADVIIGYHPTPKDRVVIVDDVCTSGTSIDETKTILMKCKPKNIQALVLVRRGKPKGSVKMGYVFSIEELLKR